MTFQLSLLVVAVLVFSMSVDELSASSSSAASSEKLKNLIKTARPNFKVKCQDLLKDFNPIVEKRTFLVTRDQKSLISQHAKNSTFEQLTSQCPSAIEANANQLELVWRYQFFESTHCIRVEFDLGNLTLFRQVLDYSYYMFSYRELGSKNIHLKRQLIEEQTNGLTISRAYIKPYIVCVSFFKRDFSVRPVPLNQTTNQTMIDCRNFSAELLDDQKLQNVDLCIDIDTPAHFLSVSQGHDDHDGFHGVNRELMMVIFILCLTVIVLSTIATCRFVIDRPRKKRYKQLKEYLNKRKQNLFQSTTGSHGSLNRDKLLGSNPSMIIVPHTHNNHHHHHLNDSNTHGGSQQFDPCEAESLLPGAHASNASLPSFQDEPVSNSSTSNLTAGNGGIASVSAALAAAAPAAASSSSSSSTALPFSNQTHGKIYFSVGETILEDLAGEATSSDARDKTPEPDQATANNNSDNKTNEDGESPKDSNDLEGTEEALKTVSHLLDDKPWSLTRRDSKLLPPEKSNLASVASQARMNP